MPLISPSVPAPPSEDRGLPAKFTDEILNRQGFRRQRLLTGINKDFKIHVSDLIKVERSRMFCSREHAISYLLQSPEYVGYLTPGLEMLFAAGHAINDLVVAKVMGDAQYGKYIWGTWACVCDKYDGKGLRVNGYKPGPDGPRCKRCGLPAVVHYELDLVIPEYRIVGHADLLMNYNNVIRIHEVKSIDRASVDFDTMKAPLGDHTLQASFYYWILVKMGLTPHNVIRYVYADRGTGKLFRGNPYKTFHVRVSPAERITPFIDKAKTLLHSIETGQLANRLPQCTDAKCGRASNCRVASTCFSLKGNALTPKPLVLHRDRPVTDGDGSGSSVQRLIRPVPRMLRKPLTPVRPQTGKVAG
jgi:hypothetical protein